MNDSNQGIFASISSGTRAKFKSLTLDDVTNAVNSFFSQSIPPREEYTVYIGSQSYMLLNASFIFNKARIKVFTYTAHRTPIVEFSLFTKSGLYKIRYNRYTNIYTAVYGTTILTKSPNLKIALNTLLEKKLPVQNFRSLILPGYHYSIRNSKRFVSTGQGGAYLCYDTLLREGLLPYEAANHIEVFIKGSYYPLGQLNITKTKDNTNNN